MKYGFLPCTMWKFFHGSFQHQLPLITKSSPKSLMKRVKNTYREILKPIPDFDKGDRFLVNILSAAMLAAVYLNLSEKPELEAVTAYYHRAMTENTVMKTFLKKSDHYNTKAQRKLARQAEKSQARNNPYSWRFRYEAGPTQNSYSAYFDTCGIVYLFQNLGISEIIPAMCNTIMTCPKWEAASSPGSIHWHRVALAATVIIRNANRPPIMAVIPNAIMISPINKELYLKELAINDPREEKEPIIKIPSQKTKIYIRRLALA